MKAWRKNLKPRKGNVMPEEKEQVIKDRDELEEKTTRLNAYLESEAGKSLDEETSSLMFRQHIYMNLYLAALNERIKNF